MKNHEFLIEVDQKFKELKLSFPLIDSAENLIGFFDNAYYSLALDGHEATTTGKTILAEIPSVIELFRYIQEDIVNRIYISPNGSAPDIPGRISGNDGVRKFQEFFNNSLASKAEKELAAAYSICKSDDLI